MIRISELKLPLDHAPEALPTALCRTLNIPASDLISHCIYKRSYDARRGVMALTYIVDCTVNDETALLKQHSKNPHITLAPDLTYTPVGHAPANLSERPLVIGFGPCGIFAALLLAQMGFKPIVLERGKAVRERTKDTWGLWRKNILNPASNVQFGEGGAGTFSDGKLYSQIKDPRHLGRKVISEFIKAGAPEEIAVVAATSEPERVVTNGMSQYSRNERNANAGIVVGIHPADYPEDTATNPLAGVILQRALESHAYVLGGKNYCAPAQLVGDFLVGKPSTEFGEVIPSYKPGVTLTDLASALPSYAIEAIREALPAFGKKIKGFDRPDAVLTGVETRTSSPIRMTRSDDYQSLNVRGLYPAGEGAGYAGGILSAGVDGIKVAEAVAKAMLSNIYSR